MCGALPPFPVLIQSVVLKYRGVLPFIVILQTVKYKKEQI
jgi:hypothetical protein